MKRRKKAKCPSCGSPFLRGRHVLRITTDGAVRQRVCQPCASLATPVLASDAPSRCQVCSTALACVCIACVAKALREERIAKKLVGEIAKDKVADPSEWGPS